jgi:hypothetical protein
MSAAPIVIERLTWVGPLGVRFRDSATDAIIGNGLTVTASRPGGTGRAVTARPNRSGAVVFQHLPGLQDLEAGQGDAAYWASLPFTLPFVVLVTDALGRYHPFRFTVDLPHQGLFTWAGASPLDADGVPLYAAPTAGPPSGLAVVRADLWNALADQPAAWATLEARVASGPWVRGVADRAGRVLVLPPYPAPPPRPLGSPAGSAQPLVALEWAMQLRATYAPQQTVPALLDLDTLLAQPPAPLWADTTRTWPLPAQTLRLGRECVVRSDDALTGAPLSVLLLTPAGSPL